MGIEGSTGEAVVDLCVTRCPCLEEDGQQKMYSYVILCCIS